LKFYLLDEMSCRQSVWAGGLRQCDPATTVLMAARPIADDTPFSLSRAVALVRRFAAAAGMRGRSHGLHRNRNETSGKREQQK
jgi:hypothetical protein